MLETLRVVSLFYVRLIVLIIVLVLIGCTIEAVVFGIDDYLIEKNLSKGTYERTTLTVDHINIDDNTIYIKATDNNKDYTGKDSKSDRNDNLFFAEKGDKISVVVDGRRIVRVDNVHFKESEGDK